LFILVNLKKIGVSALAGSLAVCSAHAADVSVTGSLAVTYTNQDTTEVDGNPLGMDNEFNFNISGEMENGFGVSYFMNMGEQAGGMDSAKLSVDMGGLGTVAFDQGSGSGLANYDDVTPKANEEVWDGLDTSGSGLTGQLGSGGRIQYKNTISDGVSVDAAYGMGSSANNTDGATSGSGDGGGYSVAVNMSGDSLGMDGVTLGAGYGEIDTGAGQNDQEDMGIWATYAMGSVSFGLQRNELTGGAAGATEQIADLYSIAFNVNEDFAVSYGVKNTDFEASGSATVEEEVDGFGFSYTMGSMKIAGNRNEGKKMGGVANADDVDTEIKLSFAF
jgi:outer membrane protein OmpU